MVMKIHNASNVSTTTTKSVPHKKIGKKLNFKKLGYDSSSFFRLSFTIL